MAKEPIRRQNGGTAFRKGKNRRRWLGCTLVCLLLCACTGLQEPMQTEERTPEPTQVPLIVIEDVPNDAEATTPEPEEGKQAGESAEQTDAASEQTPEPTATPVNRSLTTGRALPEGKLHQPVLVSIGNAPEVRPQTGLLEADLIYEFALDRTENQTRFVAVYNDAYPDLVGPVQDARAYFLSLQQEWNGAFVFNGYPEDPAYPSLDDYEIAIAVGNTAENKPYFAQDRTVNSEAGNTLFCRLKTMTENLYGMYSPLDSAVRFVFEKDVRFPSGKDMDKVGLAFYSSDMGKAEFVYNREDNRLYRYERNSKGALVQSKTLQKNQRGNYQSQPLWTQNLIIQYVKYTNVTDDYRDAVLVGSGKCDYFVNGRYFQGEWKRGSLTEPTRYLLNNGKPVALEPGSTWIVMQPALRKIKIRLAAS